MITRDLTLSETLPVFDGESPALLAPPLFWARWPLSSQNDVELLHNALRPRVTPPEIASEAVASVIGITGGKARLL
jgi:hypothetical protein